MIKVLLFAKLQEEAGVHEIELEGSGRTVQSVKEQLVQEYRLPSLETSMAAINEEFVKEEDIVSPGDTVAFIPPISGG
ncbi:molybdopterin converting factor subunit 1 [Salsuginibacillus kocurii]|uniref:molybdopterin converting factor subunit 1 n=1 Tax=Salsuginibacillus kocurii TaxID=427078 RepID=UPI000363560D|nr:molybdopterin converting factor subunit 1 [Salsuginibacillus kocurii]